MTIDEATPGWGMPGCRGEKTPAPKDAPVEPDFAAMAAEFASEADYGNLFAGKPWLAEVLTTVTRLAFAAGRQAAPLTELAYNPAWDRGELGDDVRARMEADGWRMRADGSYFKTGQPDRKAAPQPEGALKSLTALQLVTQLFRLASDNLDFGSAEAADVVTCRDIAREALLSRRIATLEAALRERERLDEAVALIACWATENPDDVSFSGADACEWIRRALKPATARAEKGEE